MTIKQAFEHSGIEVKELDASTWEGKTPKGKTFKASHACGAYGFQLTLEIEGMNRVSHCIFRTAIKKIKAN